MVESNILDLFRYHVRLRHLGERALVYWLLPKNVSASQAASCRRSLPTLLGLPNRLLRAPSVGVQCRPVLKTAAARMPLTLRSQEPPLSKTARLGFSQLLVNHESALEKRRLFAHARNFRNIAHTKWQQRYFRTPWEPKREPLYSRWVTAHVSQRFSFLVKQQLLLSGFWEVPLQNVGVQQTTKRLNLSHLCCYKYLNVLLHWNLLSKSFVCRHLCWKFTREVKQWNIYWRHKTCCYKLTSLSKASELSKKIGLLRNKKNRIVEK